MNDMPFVDVPIGPKAAEWATVPPERTVLVVAHNVTTITRLLDVLPIFDRDFRVQVVVSWSGSDPFRHGVLKSLEDTGRIIIPWEQARQTEFDLVLGASHHGALTDLSGPLVILSHGIGYTKYSPGKRKTENGKRKTETRNRQTFGLSPQWVLYDGRPFASALVLSHHEQRDRLAASAPEALPVATVAGDPCYDRLVASIPRRARYREVLGTGDRTLVMVTSTWSAHSLLGSWPGLIPRLLAELPIDSFQIAVALHPNIWHGHGPGQVRSWLADCLRSGLILLPEMDGWRGGLIAADVVIGDHGSVTGYGAALGVPTMLAGFPDEDVVPGTPIAMLGKTALRLDPATSLRRQIGAAMRACPDGSAVAELVTSAPGEALRQLRSVCYRIMGLAEPGTEPPSLPVPATSITNGEGHEVPLAFQTEHAVDVPRRTVRLTRRPAELQRANQPAAVTSADADVHLCCSSDYPLRTLRTAAAVLTVRREDLPSEAGAWSRDLLAHAPSCQAAAVLDARSCIIHLRDGRQMSLRANTVPPDLLASIGYAWFSCAGSLPAPPYPIGVSVDDQWHQVEVDQ